MSKITAPMMAFFKDKGWPFSEHDSLPILRIHYRGDNGEWTCYARAKEEEQQFIFLSVYPFNAPPEKRMAMAEFVTRANYGLSIGNFEMDFADGEIRFRTSIDVEHAKLTAGLLESLVAANLTVTDVYLPGLLAVLSSDVSPAAAIAKIEG
jgi:hypothetical protein